MGGLIAEQRLQIAGFAPRSEVNGPGQRVVIWVQGCPLDCPGCFNPGTHDGEAGRSVTLRALFDEILEARGPETVGVTFSGGEPFEQAALLADLSTLLREAWPSVSLMAFSGYVLEHLRSDEAPAGSEALLRALDVLVDGPFDPWRPGRLPWRGSSNQRLWVLGRPPEVWSSGGLSAEIQISEDGEVLLSGFPDARLKRALSRALD
ncbi:MAG: 4Fe-4S single cluster domain-containing protein [Bradymonadia bacterium]